jgi:hypothetical protein
LLKQYWFCYLFIFSFFFHCYSSFLRFFSSNYIGILLWLHF